VFYLLPLALEDSYTSDIKSWCTLFLVLLKYIVGVPVCFGCGAGSASMTEHCHVPAIDHGSPMNAGSCASDYWQTG
jgi:hypothetical protein